ELIVPSFSSYLGWLSPWGLKFLRDQFLTPLLQEKTTSPERIYICRSSARHRRVLNEEVVIDYLKTRGFVPVSLETLSFQE
ncbi:glycosyltransferase family 61 protein, partial [Bacillus sp. SIMBA_161]